MNQQLQQRLQQIAAENKYTQDNALECLHALETGARIAVEVMQSIAEAALPEWKMTADCLPEKPGKLAYEQIECYVFVDGRIDECMWNCEHEVWDDRDGDDFKYEPLHPTHWIEKPIPQPPKVKP